MSIKCKVIFDHLDMCDIVNMKISTKEKIKHIDNIEDGNYELPPIRRAYYAEDKIQNFYGSNAEYRTIFEDESTFENVARVVL